MTAADFYRLRPEQLLELDGFADIVRERLFAVDILAGADHAFTGRQLARLAKQGYRFSMDNLTHLDIDLEELSSRHFGYIKVPAATLLTGMKEARSRFLSSDIKQAMRRFGIDLIAEKIEEEATVVGLLEYELDFGQGYLFGEPRRSRGPDELQSTAQSAA